MHDDQLDIPVELAQRLVAEQFQDWKDLPVRMVASAGTMHAIARIGDALAARFPLRADDPVSVRARLEQEQLAMREFAQISPSRSQNPSRSAILPTGTRSHGQCRPGCPVLS